MNPMHSFLPCHCDHSAYQPTEQVLGWLGETGWLTPTKHVILSRWLNSPLYSGCPLNDMDLVSSWSVMIPRVLLTYFHVTSLPSFSFEFISHPGKSSATAHGLVQIQTSGPDDVDYIRVLTCHIQEFCQTGSFVFTVFQDSSWVGL